MAAAVVENPPVTSRPLFVPHLEELVGGMFISGMDIKSFLMDMFFWIEYTLYYQLITSYDEY